MKTIEQNKRSLNSNQTFTAACLGACEKLVTQLTQTKENIVAEFKGAFATRQPLLQHAINQADALAWESGYPHLLFPVLATEKIESAARWQARQQLLLQGHPAYALAA